GGIELVEDILLQAAKAPEHLGIEDVLRMLLEELAIGSKRLLVMRCFKTLVLVVEGALTGFLCPSLVHVAQCGKGLRSGRRVRIPAKYLPIRLRRHIVGGGIRRHLREFEKHLTALLLEAIDSPVLIQRILVTLYLNVEPPK